MNCIGVVVGGDGIMMSRVEIGRWEVGKGGVGGRNDEEVGGDVG